MKKIFNSKIASVVLACILLFSTLPLNLGLVSAQDNTFELNQVGSGECTVDEDGIFNLNLHGWSQATANFKIDLLKGFQFDFTTFGKTHFYFKGEGVEDTYVNELLLWEDSNGILHCQRALDGHGNKEFGNPKNQIHYLNFIKVADGYELLIDNKSFNGGGIIWSVEDFKKYNNYNESTGTFDGTYISVFSEDNPIDLSINLENNHFDRSPNTGFAPVECTVEEKGTYNLNFNSSYGLAESNFQIDLLKGFQIKFTNLAGKMYFYFSESIGAYNFGMYLYEENGNLFFDTNGGYKTSFGATMNQLHYVNFVKATNGYELCIDNKSIGVGVVWSDDDFKKHNNYNEATGTFDGAYLSVQCEVPGSMLSIDVDNNKHFGRNPDPTTGFKPVACSGEEDEGVYNLKFYGWSMTWSNFKIDLLKGFRFKFTNFGKFNIHFFNEINSNTGSGLLLYSNDNGDLLCNPYNGAYEKNLGATINETHYLYFVPVTSEEGEVTGYELCIDEIGLGDGYILSVSDFNLYNNYNENTNTFEGTYLRLYDENVAPEMKIEIAKYRPLSGDADGSCTIDALDLTVLRKYLLGIEQKDIVLENLLVNGDESVDICDLVALKKLIAH